MSQTETLLFVALGFFAALFLVLLFGRSLWAIMRSLSRRRQRSEVPDTVLSLQAQRDSLRAEKAVMEQRLDAGLSDMKMKLAEQSAEVARHRNRVLELLSAQQRAEAEISRLKELVHARDAQVAALNREIEDYSRAAGQMRARTPAPQQQATLPQRPQPTTDMPATPSGLPEEMARSARAAADALSQVVPSTARHQPNVPNLFEKRFKEASGTETVADAAVLPPNSETPAPASQLPGESDVVNQGVSNVLSLAQRLRDQQKGAKSS